MAIIFKCIFKNEKFFILIRISLKIVPKGAIDKKSSLVQVMLSNRQAISHYLNQCWPNSLTHMCGTGAGRWVNSSPPSATYMRQWTGSALLQIMAWRLFGAKPLSKPMLGYCQLYPWEQTTVKFSSKYNHFHSRKYILKYRLRNGGHFAQGRWVKYADECWVNTFIKVLSNKFEQLVHEMPLKVI